MLSPNSQIVIKGFSATTENLTTIFCYEFAKKQLASGVLYNRPFDSNSWKKKNFWENLYL